MSMYMLYTTKAKSSQEMDDLRVKFEEIYKRHKVDIVGFSMRTKKTTRIRLKNSEMMRIMYALVKRLKKLVWNSHQRVLYPNGFLRNPVLISHDTEGAWKFTFNVGLCNMRPHLLLSSN